MSDLRASLLDPAFDVSLAPDASLREYRYGFGEVGGVGELVGALSANAEHGGDLGCADEFHGGSVADALDTVKSAVHTALDTVKGGTMKSASPYTLPPQGHSLEIAEVRAIERARSTGKAPQFVVRSWRDGMPHWSQAVNYSSALAILAFNRDEGLAPTWMQPVEYPR